MIEESLDRLKVSARMTDVDRLEVREFVNDWVLLTYDIPDDEDGRRARREFLHMARLAGAVQHTESVYVFPWTPLADIAILEVAAHGRAFVWYSKARDEEMAKSITRHYDQKADSFFDEVEERLEKIKKHLVDEHFKLASRMIDKTEPMINGLEKTAVQRGSLELYERWKELYKRFDAARTLARMVTG